MGKAWEKPHFLGLAESQGPNFLRGQPVLGGNGSKKGASGPRKWLRADICICDIIVTYNIYI
jgi:hypothetical protein